jgi:hypothetical protein
MTKTGLEFGISVIVICLLFDICDLEFLFPQYFSPPKQFSIFTVSQIAPGVADFESAAVYYLFVPGPCSACALGIPVFVLGSCSDGVPEVAVSVPGSCSASAAAFFVSVAESCSDGVLGIPVSVPESCSASVLGVAVCVLAASSDICSEHLEVAPALLVGDF